MLSNKDGKGPRLLMLGSFASFVVIAAVVAGVLATPSSISNQGGPYPQYATAGTGASPMPRGVPMGVPQSMLDPGFLGWSATVQGHAACDSSSAQSTTPPVQMYRGPKLVVGQYPNANGDFQFTIPWPNHTVNGGGPADYLIQLGWGTKISVTLELGHITYVSLTGPCS